MNSYRATLQVAVEFKSSSYDDAVQEARDLAVDAGGALGDTVAVMVLWTDTGEVSEV